MKSSKETAFNKKSRKIVDRGFIHFVSVFAEDKKERIWVEFSMSISSGIGRTRTSAGTFLPKNRLSVVNLERMGVKSMANFSFVWWLSITTISCNFGLGIFIKMGVWMTFILMKILVKKCPINMYNMNLERNILNIFVLFMYTNNKRKKGVLL